MKKFLKWAAIIFVGLLVIGMIFGEDEASNQETPKTTLNKTDKTVENNSVESETVKDEGSKTVSKKVVKAPEYKVLEDEVDGRIKRTVKVELSSRTDEHFLEEIAEEIKKLSKKKVERTFIGYWIAGEDNTQGYWATTNYDPDLDVKIMGLSGTDYNKLVNAKAEVNGEILGTWMISRGVVEYKNVAYKKDGDDKVYLVDQHLTGSTERVYNATETDDGLKLVDVEGNDFGEYLVINNDGELEFWSENGNFYTARPLK